MLSASSQLRTYFFHGANFVFFAILSLLSCFSSGDKCFELKTCYSWPALFTFIKSFQTPLLIKSIRVHDFPCGLLWNAAFLARLMPSHLAQMKTQTQVSLLPKVKDSWSKLQQTTRSNFSPFPQPSFKVLFAGLTSPGPSHPHGRFCSFPLPLPQPTPRLGALRPGPRAPRRRTRRRPRFSSPGLERDLTPGSGCIPAQPALGRRRQPPLRPGHRDAPRSLDLGAPPSGEGRKSAAGLREPPPGTNLTRSVIQDPTTTTSAAMAPGHGAAAGPTA